VKQLKKCLSIRRRIQDIDERIKEYKYSAMSPKNQIITDMPRSHSSENGSDNYLLKVEKYEHKKELLLSELNDTWNCILNTYKQNDVPKETIILIHYRFYCGNSWKKTCEYMQQRFPCSNWNENKCFRTLKKCTCYTSND